jgi:hypothetical protein
MVFIDWTLSGDESAGLDGGTKYAGASSLQFSKTGTSGDGSETHNTFSANQQQVILWTRTQISAEGWATSTLYVGLSTYGYVSVTPSIRNEWQKFRATFWYDASSNTKWGRTEKWTGGAWVQEGGDVNCGAGSPANGSLILRHVHQGNTGGHWSYGWFDELEVYS